MSARDELLNSLFDADHRPDGDPESDLGGRAATGALLDAAREELTPDTEDWSPIREGRLVGRVLARTTREDLSWRGELRLVAGFVRERLSGSPLLRIVAASLVLHIVAVPALAWYVYRDRGAPEPTLHIGIEGTPDTGIVEPEPEADPTALDGEGGLVDPATLEARADALLAARIENARRRARFVLTTTRPVAGTEAPELSRDASLDARLLAARLRLLETRVWPAEAWTSGLDRVEDWASANSLTRALWVELLLDRYVLTGERSPLLARALNDLALAHVGDPVEEDGGTDDVWLARAALERACSYGLWECTPDFDPRSAPRPLDPVWFQRLEDALVTAPGETRRMSAAFAGWIRH